MAKRFQRRRLKCEKTKDGHQVMTKSQISFRPGVPEGKSVPAKLVELYHIVIVA